jgi:hypothetical protein
MPLIRSNQLLLPKSLGDIFEKETREKPESKILAASKFWIPASSIQASPVSGSGRESLCGAGLGLCGLFFPVFRRSVGLERTEQTRGDTGDFVNRSQEWRFVRFGRFVEPTDFSHELKRSSANLRFSDRGIEIEERFDISTHC